MGEKYSCCFCGETIQPVEPDVGSLVYNLGHLDLFVCNYVDYEYGTKLYESNPALVASPVTGDLRHRGT